MVILFLQCRSAYSALCPSEFSTNRLHSQFTLFTLNKWNSYGDGERGHFFFALFL